MPGAFTRVSAHRRDCLDRAAWRNAARRTRELPGFRASGVGKVDDLFARPLHHRDAHSQQRRRASPEYGSGWRTAASGFLFANLVDFDQLFGHRNDAAGFYGALREFDRALPILISTLSRGRSAVHHGRPRQRPDDSSTDHARECVPLLVAGPRVRAVDLGRRSTFSDLGATVAEWFGLAFRGRGQSFLAQLVAE